MRNLLSCHDNELVVHDNELVVLKERHGGNTDEAHVRTCSGELPPSFLRIRRLPNVHLLFWS